MSGRKAIVNSGAVSVVASATKTLLAIKAPATHGIIATLAEVEFEGAAAANDKAITLKYCTCTTDGTGTTLTLANADRQDDSLPGTTAKKDYSAEPTGDIVVLRDIYVDGNKGNDSFPGAIRLKANEVFFIQSVAPSGITTVNAKATIGFDE
jgi:hypothetical protein